jgi:hypothetical protein
MQPPGITDRLKGYTGRTARKVGHRNEVMGPRRRGERDYRGDTWQDATSEGGGRIDVMDTFRGRLMWRRGRRVADDVWMMRKKEDYADHRKEVEG